MVNSCRAGVDIACQLDPAHRAPSSISQCWLCISSWPTGHMWCMLEQPCMQSLGHMPCIVPTLTLVLCVAPMAGGEEGCPSGTLLHIHILNPVPMVPTLASLGLYCTWHLLQPFWSRCRMRHGDWTGQSGHRLGFSPRLTKGGTAYSVHLILARVGGDWGSHPILISAGTICDAVQAWLEQMLDPEWREEGVRGLFLAHNTSPALLI